MAYISQENKKAKESTIKSILRWYGLKGSLSIRHHSTLHLNIQSGKIDFIESFNRLGQSKSWKSLGAFKPVTDGYIQVNPYWFHEDFDGEAKECIAKLFAVMDEGNHDNSDPQVDHFDVGWYTDIYIGKWDKPYVYKK